MQRLGTLEGIGTLQVGAATYRPVSYRISVWREDKGWLTAAGTLHGEPAALVAALEWGECPFTLESGETVTVQLRRIESGGARAEVRVSGQLPDPTHRGPRQARSRG